jgi:hypothetical protein
MSAKKQLEKEIREAYVFLREKNMSVPSETLQFMLDASIEKLNKESILLDSIDSFYCVSSDALVYGKPCSEWCEDLACKEMLKNKYK